MRTLEPKKLLMLITSRELQRLVLDTARDCGVGGYTITPASGAGASGVQSGMLDGDSNVVIHIILSEARLMRLLAEIDRLMDAGYRVKALVSDIAILPRKGSSSSAP
jgi:hypothetical protein